MKNEDEPKVKRLKPGDAQKLTMAEVAKYVGVSAMTVSRVLRNSPRVARRMTDLEFVRSFLADY